jgi:ABC-type sugar transport system ATPase subunit
MSSAMTTGAEPRDVGGATAPPALRLTDIRKTYPGTQALKGVSLEIAPGEVRALVGENGSGKSTLIGVLGGKIAADPGGEVQIGGEVLSQGDPGTSQRLGVAVIHQELMVVPTMSALDNVFLGDHYRRGPMVDLRRMRGEFAELAQQLGIDIDPAAPAGSMSIAQQTLLEIMRAVRRRARVLLLDEPTATLGVPEREKLYQIVRSLKARGVACLFISHDLDEVLDLCDSMTVFREGAEVRTAPRAEWTRPGLVRAMLGHKAEAVAGGETAETVEALAAILETGHAERERGPDAHSAPASTAPVLLSVRDVRAGARTSVDALSVRAGEIVGIAGLVGSGRSSFLRAVAGASPGSSGVMQIEAEEVRWPRNVPEALKHGIALLPEDRKHHGLVLDMNAYDNVTLSDLEGVASRRMLSKRRSIARATELLEAVNFHGRIDEPVRNLSGGNQQKVLVAKWLHRGPKILLIDEPTRGVDIGAKAEMMRVIRDLAEAGHAIVWVSSELGEVVAVSHRVLLMANGRLVGELHGAEMTTDNILEGIFAAADQ